MNTSLLNDFDLCKKLRESITEYFINNNNTADQNSIWNGFKAYIRGILIQHSFQIKKQDSQNINLYEKEIKKLEREYLENLNPSTFDKLVKAKYELNTIFKKNKTEYSLFRIKQRWYGSGNKADILLASHLKGQTSSVSN